MHIVRKYMLLKENILCKEKKLQRLEAHGNSTGPHLHFEIRYGEEFIDPSKIIEF